MRLEEAVQLSEADRESEVAVDILRDAIQTARQLHFWLQEAVKMMREHSHTHTNIRHRQRYPDKLLCCFPLTISQHPGSRILS